MVKALLFSFLLFLILLFLHSHIPQRKAQEVGLFLKALRQWLASAVTGVDADADKDGRLSSLTFLQTRNAQVNAPIGSLIRLP